MSFYNEEYKNLLAAQRVTAKALSSDNISNGDIANLTRSLVAVIDQKRIMRKQPAPKPIDTIDHKRARANARKVVSYGDHAPTADVMHDTQAPSSTHSTHTSPSNEV